jgi:hypothetical protein
MGGGEDGGHVRDKSDSHFLIKHFQYFSARTSFEQLTMLL